jgi:hypothetical protein
MLSFLYRTRRRTAPASLAWTAAALLLAAAPSAAQTGGVTTSVSAPATAARGLLTDVTAHFNLPAGHTLRQNPRLVVKNSKGRLVELLAVYITQGLPAGRGQRGLHTGNYRPGTYTVQVECVYQDGAGKSDTVLSAPVTLTVPVR